MADAKADCDEGDDHISPLAPSQIRSPVELSAGGHSLRVNFRRMAKLSQKLSVDGLTFRADRERGHTILGREGPTDGG